MIERGAGCREIRLSGSVRGRVATRARGEILWHRRKTRRATENTNFALQPRGAPDLLETPDSVRPRTRFAPRAPPHLTTHIDTPSRAIEGVFQQIDGEETGRARDPRPTMVRQDLA
jgi:hypothetical protein